jgi:hypothetical protein
MAALHFFCTPGMGWYVFGLCALTLVGATLPLLHERRECRKKRRPPPR